MGQSTKGDLTGHEKNRQMACITGMLATYGYLRWPLQRIGVSGLKGVTIFAEEKEVLDCYLAKLARNVPAKQLKNLKRMEVKNFELGFYILTHREKEEEVQNFLAREDFLPVLGVSGLVPQFALDETYVLRVDKAEFEGYNWSFFEARMAKIFGYFIENVGSVLEEAQRYWNFEEADEVSGFSAIFGLTAHLFLDGLVHTGEENAKDLQHTLRRIFAGQKKFQQSWADMDGLTEVVCRLMHQFVQNVQGIVVVDCQQIEEKTWPALEEGKAILFDGDHYYVPQELFAESCRKLSGIISMPKLKLSLQQEGTLVCNDISDRNYTTKKVISSAMGQTGRYRFLKFRKEEFLDESGLGLEDVWREE